MGRARLIFYVQDNGRARLPCYGPQARASALRGADTCPWRSSISRDLQWESLVRTALVHSAAKLVENTSVARDAIGFVTQPSARADRCTASDCA
jgi:hypothetical protein